jgi:hypothetical protein
VSVAETFANPVVRGVAPDPSVCRMGIDFFLATRTFEYWPGIPIHHSTDLVNWELIGHAVTRPDPAGRWGRPVPAVRADAALRRGAFFLACTSMAPRDPDPGWVQDWLTWGGAKVGNFVVRTEDQSVAQLRQRPARRVRDRHRQGTGTETGPASFTGVGGEHVG